jgi:hypothetical protein
MLLASLLLLLSSLMGYWCQCFCWLLPASLLFLGSLYCVGGPVVALSYLLLLVFLLLWAVMLLLSTLMLLVAGVTTAACVIAVACIPALAGIPAFAGVPLVTYVLTVATLYYT